MSSLQYFLCFWTKQPVVVSVVATCSRLYKKHFLICLGQETFQKKQLVKLFGLAQEQRF